MTIERRELSPGYPIPRLVLGGWQLSRGHRVDAVDTEEALRGLQRCVDAGLDTFDCGDIYLGVEELLGRLLRVRPQARVHTKYVPDLDALPRLRRDDVEATVDRSLRRLGVERLDLVQFAWWDYTVPRYVEVARWLAELQRAGKIRLLGATNFDVPRLREIVDAGVSLVAHQVQYSLLDGRPERGMASYCGERGIALLAYGTLAGGFLSPRYLTGTEPRPPFANRSLVKYRLMIDEFGGWRRFRRLLRALSAIAERHGVSVANVAVRWVLDRPAVAAAVVGAVGERHLSDNLRIFSFRLDDEDRTRLAPFEGAGPAGDVWAVERDRSGRHGEIMKYNLGAEPPD